MSRFIISLLSLVMLTLVGCSDAGSRDIHLLSGGTPSELARTHLAAALLKQQDFTVTIEEVRLGQIWQRLWAGKADASVTVWLPQASAPFVERFFDRLDDLGINDNGLSSEVAIWPDNDKPHTLVRRGLAQDAPDAINVLSHLQWQATDIAAIVDRWQQHQNWTLAAESWLAEQAPSSRLKP